MPQHISKVHWGVAQRLVRRGFAKLKGDTFYYTQAGLDYSEQERPEKQPSRKRRSLLNL